MGRRRRGPSQITDTREIHRPSPPLARAGDDQPSAAAYREAVRDVIKSCIYGVDLNPLIQCPRRGSWMPSFTQRFFSATSETPMSLPA